jgi:hypothetical protein
LLFIVTEAKIYAKQPTARFRFLRGPSNDHSP